MNTSLLSVQEMPILVIGYGSVNQGDAYSGSLVAQMIDKLKPRNIHAISVDTLTPQLAPLILKAKTVIFIGSYYVYEQMNPELIIKHFLPGYLTADFDTGYDSSPQNLLAFTNTIYHHVPEAYWILIPAITHRLNDHLSHTTQEGIRKVLNYFGLTVK